MGDRKSKELIALSGRDSPAGVQIFGCEPDVMARSVAIVENERPDFIDIHMGCPAPKVTKTGAGSSLMKSPALIEKIVRAVSDASGVPVTVKLRTGYDAEHINVVDCALAAQSGGAGAVTVHGRCREQMYAPPVDLKAIADVKRALEIPVVGNGDIFTARGAKEMYERTGCDLVAVGRGAMGRPWLFEEINAYMSGGSEVAEKSARERMDVMLRHVGMIVENKGERIGIPEARKHALWYTKGLRGGAEFRRRLCEIRTLDELRQIAFEIASLNE